MNIFRVPIKMNSLTSSILSLAGIPTSKGELARKLIGTGISGLGVAILGLGTYNSIQDFLMSRGPPPAPAAAGAAGAPAAAAPAAPPKKGYLDKIQDYTLPYIAPAVAGVGGYYLTGNPLGALAAYPVYSIIQNADRLGNFKSLNKLKGASLAGLLAGAASATGLSMPAVSSAASVGHALGRQFGTVDPNIIPSFITSRTGAFSGSPEKAKVQDVLSTALGGTIGSVGNARTAALGAFLGSLY